MADPVLTLGDPQWRRLEVEKIGDSFWLEIKPEDGSQWIELKLEDLNKLTAWVQEQSK